jgi:arginine decarboxylase
MTIQVSAGTGSGPTKLSAFDSALQSAGIANYNIIRLSSIIPAGAKIEEVDCIETEIRQPGKWGDRLYAVMAELRTDTPNVEAWAGIGWVQDNKTGRGLFVEHEGASETQVRRDIEQSLEHLATTRKMKFGPVHMKVVGITCVHAPVCALVIASYQAQSWDTSE